MIQTFTHTTTNNTNTNNSSMSAFKSTSDEDGALYLMKPSGGDTTCSSEGHPLIGSSVPVLPKSVPPDEDADRPSHAALHKALRNTGIYDSTSGEPDRCSYLKLLKKKFPDHFVLGKNFGDETEAGSLVQPYLYLTGQENERIIRDTVSDGACHEAHITLKTETLKTQIRHRFKNKDNFYNAKHNKRHFNARVEVKLSDYSLSELLEFDPMCASSDCTRYNRTRKYTNLGDLKMSLFLHGSLDDLIPIVNNYSSYLRTHGSKDAGKGAVCLVPLSRIEEYFPCENGSDCINEDCPYGHETRSEKPVILTCTPCSF